MNLASALKGVFGVFASQKPASFLARPGEAMHQHFANAANWTQTPQSSWVVAIAYFYDVSKGGTQGTLRVRYKSGAVCQYDGIPPGVWTGFLAAKSKGRYVHSHLYDRPYTLVT